MFVESLRSIHDPFGSMVATLTDVCAYAGTGNVLKIQHLLHLCSEHYESKDEKKKVKNEIEIWSHFLFYTYKGGLVIFSAL